MSTNAVSNYGTLLQYESAAASGTFTTVAECRVINTPEREQEDIEVTHHSSNGAREYIPSGLYDPGELEIQINSIPGDATQQELAAMEASGETRQWRITRPNGIIETFGAYVKGISANEADATSPDAIIDTVTLKLTGPSTRTYDDSL